MRTNLGAALGLAMSLGATGAFAQDKEVTFVHQDMIVPFHSVVGSGKLEEATGYKINWQKIPGGGDVIRAMASGDAQIGEVGSSPATAAASQGIDVQMFWVLDDIANAEQLVVRKDSGIASLADLKGKKIGVPFVSTAHYQLLAALEDAGVATSEVEILNMAPPAVAAAWERGDIDATFIWDPVLSKAKENGTVLISSGDIAKMGKPTFDVIMVDRTWASENKDFMVALVKALAEADEAYRSNAAAWTPELRRSHGGRQDHRRRGRNGSERAVGLRLPDARGAGLSDLARRRRGERRRQGARGHRRVPQGAGPHHRCGSGLLEVRHRRVRQGGDVELTHASRGRRCRPLPACNSARPDVGPEGR